MMLTPRRRTDTAKNAAALRYVPTWLNREAALKQGNVTAVAALNAHERLWPWLSDSSLPATLGRVGNLQLRAELKRGGGVAERARCALLHHFLQPLLLLVPDSACAHDSSLLSPLFLHTEELSPPGAL
jgi:hypothetical protein